MDRHLFDANPGPDPEWYQNGKSDSYRIGINTMPIHKTLERKIDGKLGQERAGNVQRYGSGKR